VHLVCLPHIHRVPLQEKEAPKISKKKLRKLNRLTVAQLKQLVDRPDVVEMHDVTAQDPKLLVHLKVGRSVGGWVGGCGCGCGSVWVWVCVWREGVGGARSREYG